MEIENLKLMKKENENFTVRITELSSSLNQNRKYLYENRLNNNKQRLLNEFRNAFLNNLLVLYFNNLSPILNILA